MSIVWEMAEAFAESNATDPESFKAGWEAAVASMRPHLNQLAAQLGVAPVGDLTGGLEGVTIGAEQARVG